MQPKSNTGLWVGILIAIVIATGSLSLILHSSTANFGGVTNYDEVDATAIKIGGTNGTRVGPIISKTCSLAANTFTIAATSTALFDCAVTGVVSGDNVFVQSATTTGAFGAGWLVAGAIASSTSGFVSVSIYNGTGASAVVPAGIASSTRVLVFHTRSSIPGL